MVAMHACVGQYLVVTLRTGHLILHITYTQELDHLGSIYHKKGWPCKTHPKIEQGSKLLIYSAPSAFKSRPDE